MPTGYTAGILDGTITTFPEFAKLCMRAFGATVHLRDEGLDAEYEPRVPSDYHEKAIESQKLKLEKANEYSESELILNKKAELEESKIYHLKGIEKAKQQSLLMNKILSEVKTWEPPTGEHVNLKEFMVEQITSTLDFDCKTDYHDNELLRIENELSKLNASEIRKELIESAKSQLEYHEKNYAKEVERCNESNKWVSDLLGSL